VTLPEFQATLTAAAPPEGLPPLLVSLWHDGKGNWDEAHRIAQDLSGEDAAWVHAYLHRREGDADNAAYWYRHARQPVAYGPLAEEWDRIAYALLAKLRERRK
jgi:hypothetical protein